MAKIGDDALQLGTVAVRGGRVTDIRIFPTAEKVASEVARWFERAASDAVSARGSFIVLFAGGSTPRLLYTQLRAASVPWERVHAFWGDERFVPYDDDASNYGMTQNTLLNYVPVDRERVYPMPVEGSPRVAAEHYETTLCRYVRDKSGPVFDFVLLGMGTDGHTASLFPYSPAMKETRLVAAVDAGPAKGWRLTLTPPILRRSRQTVILVTGQEKAVALRDVLQGPPNPERLPVQAVAHENDTVIWAVDEAAAELLRPRNSHSQ